MIKERGTHEELLAKGGLYKQLYEMQFKYEAPEEEAEAPTPFMGQGHASEKDSDS